MNTGLQQFTNNFDVGVDTIRRLSRDFCDPLEISVFAYGRTYPNATVSWLTSSPDQDRFLLESDALSNEPLLDTADVLKEGAYLWFCDRQFPGCETFYRDRARLFQMDHGLMLVRHRPQYLEFSCFSGLLSKRPLYNLFMNETGLFSAFLDHFVGQLDRRTLNILDQQTPMECFKPQYGQVSDAYSVADRESLIKACGSSKFLKLSRQERACLLALGERKSYAEIGLQLELSARTVEHYLESVRNKLDISNRSELFLAARKLKQLGMA